jgi:hypothetical protein
MRLACAGDGAYGPLSISGVTRPSGNIRATTSASAASATIQISPKFNWGVRGRDDCARSGSRDKRSLPDIGTPVSEDLSVFVDYRWKMM